MRVSMFWRIAIPVVCVVVGRVAVAAAAGPTVTPETKVVPAGERYVLAGAGWSTASDCTRRVDVSRRLSHGIRIGSAPIASDGTFTFSRRVPARARRGSRIVLDLTQYCDGVGTSRTVRVRVGRRAHTCGGPLSVDGKAYLLKVAGGLSCDAGAGAIGPFLDTGIDPDGFDCAYVDPQTGHDAACVQVNHPTRRVTARHISEV
jgi:hypothetical protein